MRLRPRQSLFVERSLAALCDHGNTLSIASTGFGKTIGLSAVVAKSLEGSDAKACILAHRDELTAQMADVARVLKVDREWLIHGIGEIEGPSPFTEMGDDPVISLPAAAS